MTIFTESQKVILRRTYLTTQLFLEEFALLDHGYCVSSDGKLPEEHYCIYYRVGVDCAMYGVQYVEDYSCTPLNSLENYQYSDKINNQSIIDFFSKRNKT